MNVILFGYRGSGKSSVGRELAAKLWLDFVDTDAEVRRRFDHAPIREIWERHGEAAFREAEVAVTRELCGRDGLVIALGGGTLMQPGAREAVALAKDAKRVYLACSAAELHRRVQSDPATLGSRPALTAAGGKIEEIESVLAERDPVYRAVADVVFDVTHASVAQVVQHLVSEHL